jgi:hypothetical protein
VRVIVDWANPQRGVLLVSVRYRSWNLSTAFQTLVTATDGGSGSSGHHEYIPRIQLSSLVATHRRTKETVLGCYLELALRSLRQNVALTLLTVILVGAGVGCFTFAFTEDDRTFGQIRADAYRSFRCSIVPLAAICILLLIVTAGGIIGLNTYWVGQRRRYIDMRRALGARRIDILRYLHVENLLISGGACIAGTLIRLVLNIWLAPIAEVTRMSLI